MDTEDRGLGGTSRMRTSARRRLAPYGMVDPDTEWWTLIVLVGKRTRTPALLYEQDGDTSDIVGLEAPPRLAR